MTNPDLTDWPCPVPGGGTRDELAVAFPGSPKVLVLPAWFDEANKLRRQTIEIMRLLSLSGVGSILADLPGCNESEAPLDQQSLDGWRDAAVAAAKHFAVTHVLAIRAGSLLVPAGLPGWQYAPVGGKTVLRSMLRARTIAAKDAGLVETTEDLAQTGREKGIELAGWQLGPALFAALELAEPGPALSPIAQADIGGGALWLRAEPDESPEQAAALAVIVASGLDGR